MGLGGLGRAVRRLVARPPDADKGSLAPTRALIIDTVNRDPGARLTDIRNALGTSRSTAKHHLEILQRSGVVKVLRTHHATRYFPGDFRDDEAVDILVLRRGRVLEVAKEILRSPGSRQSELTKKIHISRRVFRVYANLLVERKLIVEEPKMDAVRYFPAERLPSILKRAATEPEADEKDPT